MGIIKLNDSDLGPAHTNHNLISWSRTGAHSTPGEGVDVFEEWDVNRTLVTANADALMWTFKAKVQVGATGEPSAGDYGVLWIAADITGEASNHFVHVETAPTAYEGRRSYRNIKYASVILPIVDEKVKVKSGSIVVGARTTVEFVGYLEAAIAYD